MPLFSREVPQADWLVVGLGNPGAEYAGTRHNVGYQVASRLAKRMRAEFAKKAADARLAEGTLGDARVAVARPGTFMNDSGHSVRRLLQRYRLEPKRLVVVYDDIDLPLGRIRIRPAGGPGTHNGMRSVVAEIGSEGFARVRLGIHPEDAPGDLADHVLSPFEDGERAVAEEMVARAAEAVEVMVRDGIQRAMAKFNSAEKDDAGKDDASKDDEVKDDGGKDDGARDP